MGILDRIRGQYAAITGGKSISHRPDLAYREHVVVRRDGVDQFNLIDQFADYAKVYGAHVWVRKAVSVIASNVAPLPVEIVDADGETIPNHPLAPLFAFPNDTNSAAELWEDWAVCMLLGGESFLEIVPDQRGRPSELWNRRPDEMTVFPDKSPERIYYPRVAEYAYKDDENRIPAPSVIHSRFKNPINPWRGIAPIAAVRNAIVIDAFAAAWSKTFLQSGARPDYAVIAPNGITPSERDDIETQLMMKFGGPSGWHRPIVLEEGITDVKPLSFAPKDIEWLEQRRFSRDEIGGVFGVPDEVMGYGRDTYENMDAAFRWLWLLTLVPFVERRDDTLNRHFTREMPMLKPGERVRTDLSGVAALSENVAEKIAAARELFNMGVPFNTIDERLGLGIGDIPGGATGYLPFSIAPVGSASQMSPVAPTGDTGENRTVSARSRNKAGIPLGSDAHKNIWESFVSATGKHERRMIRELKRQFQRQQNATLRRLRELDITRDAADGETKAQLPIPSASDVFDVRAESAVFRDAFDPFYTDAVEQFGAAAYDDVKSAAPRVKLEIGIAFDISDPVVQAMIRRMIFRFARDINRTTQNKIGDVLRVILQDANADGWSIPRIQREIYDQISNVFNVRKSDYETERIARTEINRAANSGRIEGWRQTGVVTGKSWIAAIDGRTRDTHIDVHVETQANPIPLNAEFEVGECRGDAPGQTGCPHEDINCRCTMIAVIG